MLGDECCSIHWHHCAAELRSGRSYRLSPPTTRDPMAKHAHRSSTYTAEGFCELQVEVRSGIVEAFASAALTTALSLLKAVGSG